MNSGPLTITTVCWGRVGNMIVPFAPPSIPFPFPPEAINGRNRSSGDGIFVIIPWLIVDKYGSSLLWFLRSLHPKSIKGTVLVTVVLFLNSHCHFRHRSRTTPPVLLAIPCPCRFPLRRNYRSADRRTPRIRLRSGAELLGVEGGQM